MRRAAFAWGVLVCGSWAAGAQEIQPVVHRVHGGDGEPQRIVVKLPPPQVEVRDKCDDSCERSCDRPRFCLFGRRHEHHHKERAGFMGEVLYAPASIPTMMMAPAPPVSQPVTFSQQITHDFTALRYAQEMELRAAGVAAALAARDAMRSAEDDAMGRILESSQMRMRAAGGALRAGSAAGAVARVDAESLNAALKKLDERLDALEQLVERHHDMLNHLRTQVPVPPAPKQ